MSLKDHFQLYGLILMTVFVSLVVYVIAGLSYQLILKFFPEILFFYREHLFSILKVSGILELIALIIVVYRKIRREFP